MNSPKFDIDSLIDLGAEQITYADQEQTKNNLKNYSQIYSPKYSDGKDNTYSAILRPIPNPAGESKFIISKLVHWLEDDVLGLKGYFDSKRSIKQKCDVSDTYWFLKKHPDIKMQEKAKALSPKEQNYCYALVVKDIQKPELEGKVVIWRFPSVIKKLFDSQVNPPQEEIEMGKEPCNVFNLFSGKDFLLKISKKGDWPDYSNCKFSDTPSSAKIKLEDGTVYTLKKGDPKSLEIIKSHIFNDKLPDISKYEYKEVSEEDSILISKYMQKLKTGKIETYSPQQAATQIQNSQSSVADILISNFENDSNVPNSESLKKKDKSQKQFAQINSAVEENQDLMDILSAIDDF
jgi:hypothetical protein